MPLFGYSNSSSIPYATYIRPHPAIIARSNGCVTERGRFFVDYSTLVSRTECTPGVEVEMTDPHTLTSPPLSAISASATLHHVRGIS